MRTQILLFFVIAACVCAHWYEETGFRAHPGLTRARSTDNRWHRVLARPHAGANASAVVDAARESGFEVERHLPQIGWYVLRRGAVAAKARHSLDAAFAMHYTVDEHERNRAPVQSHDIGARGPAPAAVPPHTDVGTGLQWQWHGAYPGVADDAPMRTLHLDIARLHAEGVLGSANTHIKVVDTGIARVSDVRGNVRSAWAYNAPDGSGETDPGTETHGTSCASLAAGTGGDGSAGVGACPRCALVDVRLFGRGAVTTDVSEAAALLARVDECSGACRLVMSNSWGADYASAIFAPGPATIDALQYAHEKDAVIVWAGGNGAHRGDHVQLDHFVCSPFTIGVGAVDARGHRAYYSEWGPCLFAVAPSSGDAAAFPPGVYAATNPRKSGAEDTYFTGTSAAAPQVAGAIALVRDRHPQLRNRDLEHLVVRCSEHRPGLVYGDGMPALTNAAGHRWSSEFGAGVLNATCMDRRASSWVPVGPSAHEVHTMHMRSHDGHVDTESGVAEAGTTVELHADVDTRLARLERVYVAIEMDVVGGWRTVSRVTLTSPQGMPSVLLDRNSLAYSPGTMLLQTNHFWGEQARGTYNLRIKLTTGRATIRRARIFLYGTTD